MHRYCNRQYRSRRDYIRSRYVTWTLQERSARQRHTLISRCWNHLRRISGAAMDRCRIDLRRTLSTVAGKTGGNWHVVPNMLLPALCLSPCRTRHLENLPIFQANSREASSPQATCIQRYQVVFNLQAQRRPMAANDSGFPAGAIRRLEPWQIAGLECPALDPCG